MQMHTEGLRGRVGPQGEELVSLRAEEGQERGAANIGAGDEGGSTRTYRAARFRSGSWPCSPELKPPSETGRGLPGPVAGGRGKGGAWCCAVPTSPRAPGSPSLLASPSVSLAPWDSVSPTKIEEMCCPPVGHPRGLREKLGTDVRGETEQPSGGGESL